MTVSIDDILNSNAESLLDAMGTILATYVPKLGQGREVKVHVEHNQDDAERGPGQRSRSPMIYATVLNNATKGITPDGFSSGDTLTLPARAGAAQQILRLLKIVEQDDAHVTFETR